MGSNVFQIFSKKPGQQFIMEVKLVVSLSDMVRGQERFVMAPEQQEEGQNSPKGRTQHW